MMSFHCLCITKPLNFSGTIELKASTNTSFLSFADTVVRWISIIQLSHISRIKLVQCITIMLLSVFPTLERLINGFVVIEPNVLCGPHTSLWTGPLRIWFYCEFWSCKFAGTVKSNLFAITWTCFSFSLTVTGNGIVAHECLFISSKFTITQQSDAIFGFFNSNVSLKAKLIYII